MVLNQVVGPGPTLGSQRLYVSIANIGGGFVVLAIDPVSESTSVFHSPIPTESVAWGMTVGPDGNIYLGTAATGHLVKLDVMTGTMTDLGIPSPTEQYIWQLAVGSDNLIYGVTYPNCKLVRLDPASGHMSDLGRLDPTQAYARQLAASKDGFIYAGVGSASMNVAIYQISTGSIKEVFLPGEEPSGFPTVFLGIDGNSYAFVGNLAYRLSSGSATEIPAAGVSKKAPQNVLSDGRAMTATGINGQLVVQIALPNGQIEDTFTAQYKGELNDLFRVGLGPDGNIYGSGVMPSNLVQFDLSTGTSAFIGQLGAGEVYSFSLSDGRLIMGAYSDGSSLLTYDPAQEFGTAAGSSNPQFIAIPNDNAGWRPEASVVNSDGRVTLGAVAGYGLLTGPLIVWNPGGGSAQVFYPVPDQSVVSLSVSDGLVIGGTSVSGGGGSNPTQPSAVLFEWDPNSEQVVFETVPVVGAKTITDLISTSDGEIYGFADNTLFEFNPRSQTVLRTATVPFSGLIYNSIGIDDSGRIWGLASGGIFSVDPELITASITATPPRPITGGFAISRNLVFFISGPSVYSYNVPAAMPTFSVAPGTYLVPQTVTIADATPGAAIYFTTNGNTPTTGAMPYNGPFTISSSETLQAIAIASGFSQSAMATASYTITPPTDPVAPRIRELDPGYVAAGSSDFTIKIKGTGFSPGSTVNLGGKFPTSRVVDSTEIDAEVPASAVIAPGIVAITVQNSTAGGETSNAVQFEIDSLGTSIPSPAIQDSTATVIAGSSATFNVELPSTVEVLAVKCLNLPDETTCAYSPSTQTLSVTTLSTTMAETCNITVVFDEMLSGPESALCFLPVFLLWRSNKRRNRMSRRSGRILNMIVILVTMSLVVSCSLTRFSPLSRTLQGTKSAIVGITIHQNDSPGQNSVHRVL